MANANHTADRTAAPSLAAELRSLISKMRRRLREQADVGDLTPSQTSAWIRLERDGPLTVSALARAEGVRPQSMGATIAVLQDAGLVNGAPDPADGRQTILTVTARSRERVAAGRAAQQDWLTRVIDRELTPQERLELARAIDLLRRIADA
jgi:DNA-binding MarR family transcriptional regulator